MIIETEHLIVRKFGSDDVEELATIVFAYLEVMRFSLSGVRTKEQTKDFIQWCINTYEQVGHRQ